MVPTAQVAAMMMTPIAARGSKGEIVRVIQAGLDAHGWAPGAIDGDFGPKTEAAVERLQVSLGLEGDGEVTTATWRAITAADPPSSLDLCLQLTAAFEGHGFRLVRGNFDGAGITWGIIGFTLIYGSIGRVVHGVERRSPGLVHECFGGRAKILMDVLGQSQDKQLAWADSISFRSDKASVYKPWRESFARFGSCPEVQAEQVRLAEADYFLPALQTARSLDLNSLLGLSLAFDIHVQNGGLKEGVRGKIAAQIKAQPTVSEQERRIIIANAVADASNPKWAENVRSRKLAIAAGAGKVHGDIYVLRNWGLGEQPFS